MTQGPGFAAGGAEPSPQAVDHGLLRAHVLGDPNAFGELVRRYQDRLWWLAVQTIGDREEAADALQDALLSAFRAAGSFRGESAVSTWLHRIVVNACIDRARRRQARPTVPLHDGRAASNNPYPAADSRIDLRSALGDIPEGQRAAIILVDLQGLSVVEAATILGVAEGTVKSRCARGRNALARILRAQQAAAGGGQ
jgi:RNA polymerase sigma-70 factor (ECF subfamily)